MLEVFLFFMLILSCEIAFLQINKRTYQIFNHQRREFTQLIHQAFLQMDYAAFDDNEKLDQAYAAFEPTYNNTAGIENIYHTLFELGWKILSVVIITLYLASINFWIAPICILWSLLKLYFSLKTKDIEQQNLEEYYQYKRKLIYVTYDSSDIAYGKEKRIYKFSNNIKRYFDNYLNGYYAFLTALESKRENFTFLLRVFRLAV